MSGRGLGHTGGTLDKLESIPGCCVEQTMESFKNIVRENGVSVIGQTGNLVPADKKMYALRDVTATVRSIPLIASSIMSKKLASGADAIVLDVKTGSGAFMRTKEEAYRLARTMVKIGTLLNKQVCALVTDMNQPLGNAVGNALEVQEAVELLSGKIPETDPLYEVCMVLGEHMLLVSGITSDLEEGRKLLRQKIEDGSGLKKLQHMITLQGGDASYLTCEGMEKLVEVKQHIDVCALKDGVIASMQAESIGTAAQLLGAGRAKKEDTIDPSVGLVMKVRCGDRVKTGQTLCTLYVNDDTYLDDAKHLLLQAIRIEDMCTSHPMIYKVFTKDTLDE